MPAGLTNLEMLNLSEFEELERMQNECRTKRHEKSMRLHYGITFDHRTVTSGSVEAADGIWWFAFTIRLMAISQKSKS